MEVSRLLALQREYRYSAIHSKPWYEMEVSRLLALQRKFLAFPCLFIYVFTSGLFKYAVISF